MFFFVLGSEINPQQKYIPEISTDLIKGALVLTCSDPNGKMQYSLISCRTSPKQGSASLPSFLNSEPT